MTVSNDLSYDVVAIDMFAAVKSLHAWSGIVIIMWRPGLTTGNEIWRQTLLFLA